MISYKPLWKTLIDRDMNKEQLRLAIGVTPQTMTRMSKGEMVNLKIIGAICEVLDVPVSDVIEYVKER